MNNHRLKSESETVKQTDYMKKQQQLRAMNKPFVPNKSMNADAMIENLLSNKETFQKKKDNSIKAPQPPSWLLPDHSSVSPFYSQLWHLVRMSTGQLADTASVSSLLMTSGLSTDTLGFIWSLANRTVPGSLTQAELYAVLALVALAQGGYIFNDASILNQIPQPPIPKLDLTILPQYNMNFTTHSSGHSTHYLQQNPAAIDSTLSLDNSTTKEPTPVSIVSLDVNKLQGAPVLTLPNYNFGMPYQGFDVKGAGAVITNKNNTSVQSVPVYQEPSSAIPSISLGLSTPTKVNNYQPLNEKNSDCDSTSKEANNDVVSFNNINKFKLDSPTKLPSLSQPSDVARKFSNLSLQDSKKGEEVENQAGQTSVDDSFDSLSTERATNRAAAPNYNLDLFELTAEVQHVFPNCETSVKDTDSNRGENLVTEKTLIDGDFDDDFTDFQSADFTSFNAPPREASIDALKSTPATSIDALKSTSSFDVLKDVQLSTDIFNSTSETSIHVLKSTPSIDVLKNVQLSTNIFKPTVETSLKSTPETSIDVLKSIPVINFSIDVPKSTPAVELAPKFEPEDDDDFSNFQEAPIPIEDDLFPKTITINEIGCKNVDNSLYDKSEPNYSEWSDTTSNDWSGGNKSDEKDTDSLNYVDLSDIKLEIPTSDTEDAMKIDAVTLDVIKSEAVTLGVMKSDAVTLDVKEDKYSALRGLQPSQDVATNDDFGDFLAAEPGECQMSNDMDVNNSSVQIRCLEACLHILQESYSILSSASTPKVLSEVISDPRTINHLTCLLEVFRVSERLIKHVENNDIVSQIQSTWNAILPLLEGSRCYQLEDTTGPVCELCRCNSGPFPMKYGRSTFHAPCANLYLHYVDSTLPNSEAF